MLKTTPSWAPCRVYTLKPILQANFFWRGDFHRREINLGVIGPRRQNDFVAGALFVLADSNVCQINRRFGIGGRQFVKIEHGEAFRSSSPEFAVTSQSQTLTRATRAGS